MHISILFNCWLITLQNRFTLLEVPEGSVIVEQGSDEERLFLVLSGKVALIQVNYYNYDSLVYELRDLFSL